MSTFGNIRNAMDLNKFTFCFYLIYFNYFIDIINKIAKYVLYYF